MFRNEPLIDFTIADNREQFRSSLLRTNSEFAQGKYFASPIIGGKEIKTAVEIASVDPTNPAITLGPVYLGGAAEAEQAMNSVLAGSKSWAHTDYRDRAAIIRHAGSIMREEKRRLSAVIIREAGKPWKEADADVAEAIDFCDYYADEMLRLGPPIKTQEVPGEDNFYFYQPRGVCLVVSPWNFPLAIACGMVTAALVTGNTAILKPAEPTCIIAHELVKILLRAGVPADAVALLPGKGSVIGKMLVENKNTAMICFTGSKEVGLDIIQRAGTTPADQHHVKKVIAEMGGKNAVIIDSDADLDDAIRGVIYSAFGFAGQKCSACSRCIIVGDAYEPFLARLKEAAKDIIIGDPAEPSTLLNPVIDERSHKRILETIAAAEKTSKLLFKGGAPDVGYFVPAVIFRDVDTRSSLWQEEIFGPVLACAQAPSFDKAIEMANDSQYALTGGLFSRNPGHIEQAKREFRVGNLYINRGCTGALVCRQPFGGFKMSGIGSKAGGMDYLLQFLEPRTVTENTMRRGFSPS